jgi:hypothetical protein
MSPLQVAGARLRRITVPAAAACAALLVSAASASAFKVQVVNESGMPPQNVYVMLEKTSSSDGQLPDEVGKPLSEISNSTFSIASISGGRIYVSYGAPVPTHEPNYAPIRYDKIELTGPVDGGVANLTAVDFFAIPFDLQALDSSGATVGNALTYRCNTRTILQRLQALAPSAEVTSGGQFVRFLSPQLSPSSYPSMTPYVQSMSGQKIYVNDSFGKKGQPTLEISYSGTFEANGSITLEGTMTNEVTHRQEPAKELHIEGATLPSAVYTGDGPFTVGGEPANVGENNQYSVIYRDIVAGFGLGYWGGRYGNNTTNWLRRPDFAAARLAPAPYITYDPYAALIGEYSEAYGYSFHDLGPSPVTVPLTSSEETLRLTIDPEEGPSAPGCIGEATPFLRELLGGPEERGGPGERGPRGERGAQGRAKVTINARAIKLDKRGRALLNLTCSGDPCKGALTLDYTRAVLVRSRSRKHAGHRRAHAARVRRRLTRKTVTIVLGRAEFSIAEGGSQQAWVTVTKQGLEILRSARGRHLSVLVEAAVGPRTRPTIAGERRVTLESYTPPRHGRRRR